MNIYEILFILSLLSMIALVLYKIYNVMSTSFGKPAYDVRISWIGLILFLLMFGIGFAVSMLNPAILVYSRLMLFGGILLGLEVLFHIVEILFVLANYEKETTIKPKMSAKEA